MAMLRGMATLRVGRCQLSAAACGRNVARCEASKRTELVAVAAATAQSASRQRGWNTFHAPTRESPMSTERADPNAELANADPFRIAFAVFALLLGCLAAFH
jgi:hypothetical protein